MATLTIRVRGQDTVVAAVHGAGYSILRTGRVPGIAQIFDDDLLCEADFPTLPAALELMRQQAFKADLFTYARPFGTTPCSDAYPVLRDNLAVVETRSFDQWWSALPQESRKNMRLAEKRGVTVRTSAFDENLVRGIKGIYDETPLRQGRPFWHFRQPLERVNMLNASYAERSEFISAYLNDELIGYVKFVVVDKVANLVQIIAKESHRDKKTVNALLRHSIERCSQLGLETLTYGKFDYGVNQNSSLAEFKRRNGFRQLDFPRCFVPLSGMGRLALSTGLHAGWRAMLPPTLLTRLHSWRGKAMQLVYRPSGRGAR